LELRQKAIQTAVGILRCLGNKVTSVAGSDEPTWKTLRDILMEGLEICRGAPSVLSPTLSPRFLCVTRCDITNSTGDIPTRHRVFR